MVLRVAHTPVFYSIWPGCHILAGIAGCVRLKITVAGGVGVAGRIVATVGEAVLGYRAVGTAPEGVPR